jgi:hypothetical protein
MKHLLNPRWREVFLLSAGLLEPADELLLSIEREARKLIQTQALRDLLLWCERTPCDSDGRFATAGGRVAVLALALALDLDLVLVLTLANGLANSFNLNHALPLATAYVDAGLFSKSICDSLRSVLLPIDEGSLSTQQREELRGSIIEILGIPLANITKEDYQSLKNYLSAQQLLLDCRNTALRVSHSVWEGILGRMLIVD